jgi:hypothetical protein
MLILLKARELKLVMHSLGHPVTGKDIEEMIKEADTNGKLLHFFVKSQNQECWFLMWFYAFLADGKVDFKGKFFGWNKKVTGNKFW